MATKKNNQVNTPVDQASIVTLTIADIEPNYDNARSGDWTRGTSKEQPQGNSYEELKGSIKTEGLKVPVLVRPIPEGSKRAKGSKARYQLVYGYRRWYAVKELATEAGTKLDQAYIQAQVKPLSDYEARLENTLENSSRDDLSGPDLGYAALQTSIEYARAGRGALSDNQLAKAMGKNQSYLSQLLRVWRLSTTPELPVENRDIPNRWRNADVDIPVNTMVRIAGIKDPKTQLAEFEKTLTGKEKAKAEKEAAREAGETAGAQGWIDRAKKQAKKSAEIIGALARENYIAEFEGDWDAALELLGCKVKEDSTQKQRKAIGKEAAKAYKEAFEYVADETEETEETEEAAE